MASPIFLMFTNPRVSVVTIAFNDRAALESTLRSVTTQRYPALEYIVLDGGSTDGSVELLNSYTHTIDTWTSEADRGIYDAINKGAMLSTGEWIVFMNAGDEFIDQDTVANVMAHNIDDAVTFIYGHKIVKYSTYQILRKSGSIENLWKGSQFSHQAVFIRNSFQKHHPYKLDNRISADFELFYAAYRNGFAFQRLDMPMARVAAGGLSDVARIENLSAFYRVVRSYDTTPATHMYYLGSIALNSAKLLVKKLIPSSWIHRYRKAIGQRA